MKIDTSDKRWEAPLSKGKFPLGQVFLKADAESAIPVEEIRTALERHCQGDWGDISTKERRRNENGLRKDGRLFSAYTSAGGLRFWVISEANRAATGVMLPHEFST